MLRLDYAMLPLFVYLFLKMIYSGDRKYLIFLAVTISVFAAYKIMLITFIMFAVILILDIIISGRERISTKLFSVGALAGLVFLLMAAKFVPIILYSSAVEPAAVTDFNINLIQRENILNIITLKLQEWTAVGFELTFDDNFSPSVYTNYTIWFSLSIPSLQKIQIVKGASFSSCSSYDTLHCIYPVIR